MTKKYKEDYCLNYVIEEILKLNKIYIEPKIVDKFLFRDKDGLHLNDLNKQIFKYFKCNLIEEFYSFEKLVRMKNHLYEEELFKDVILPMIKKAKEENLFVIFFFNYSFLKSLKLRYNNHVMLIDKINEKSIIIKHLQEKTKRSVIEEVIEEISLERLNLVISKYEQKGYAKKEGDNGFSIIYNKK